MKKQYLNPQLVLCDIEPVRLMEGTDVGVEPGPPEHAPGRKGLDI